VDDPDVKINIKISNDLPLEITKKIEKATLEFQKEVQSILSKGA
jgi:predicted DNA binding CopG/RHH family protein